jgi:hypothetical protein
LILNNQFIWLGIHTDIKNFIKSYPICQQTRKIITKKQNIKQIITNYPKERYVVDIVNIKKDFDDDKHRYKYILNIIDHFTKYLYRNKN